LWFSYIYQSMKNQTLILAFVSNKLFPVKSQQENEDSDKVIEELRLTIAQIKTA